MGMVFFILFFFHLLKVSRITEWSCYIIPASAKLSFLDYNRIAGAYNDIHSHYAVHSTDYTRLAFLRAYLQSNHRLFKKTKGYDYARMYDDIKLVCKDFTSSERVEQYTRCLIAIVGDNLKEDTIMEMVTFTGERVR